MPASMRAAPDRKRLTDIRGEVNSVLVSFPMFSGAEPARFITT
jgi:hypothetical protein